MPGRALDAFRYCAVKADLRGRTSVARPTLGCPMVNVVQRFPEILALLIQSIKLGLCGAFERQVFISALCRWKYQGPARELFAQLHPS